jgi:DNA-binding NarL/FixJ family response regulator
MSSPKQLARIAGVFYLLVGIFGGFAEGFGSQAARRRQRRGHSLPSPGTTAVKPKTEIRLTQRGL